MRQTGVDPGGSRRVWYGFPVRIDTQYSLAACNIRSCFSDTAFPKLVRCPYALPNYGLTDLGLVTPDEVATQLTSNTGSEFFRRFLGGEID